MSNPIHKNEDGWYFWDELWADEYGLYSTEEECKAKLKEYCDFMGI
jgi:hypothetical protein